MSFKHIEIYTGRGNFIKYLLRSMALSKVFYDFLEPFYNKGGKCIIVISSILVMTCVMFSDAHTAMIFLYPYPITTLQSPITNILIWTLLYKSILIPLI